MFKCTKKRNQKHYSQFGCFVFSFNAESKWKREKNLTVSMKMFFMYKRHDALTRPNCHLKTHYFAARKSLFFKYNNSTVYTYFLKNICTLSMVFILAFIVFFFIWNNYYYSLPLIFSRINRSYISPLANTLFPSSNKIQCFKIKKNEQLFEHKM